MGSYAWDVKLSEIDSSADSSDEKVVLFACGYEYL